VLAGEPQVNGELLQGGGQAGDRGQVDALVAGGEQLGAAGGLLHRGLPWRLVELVEDLPVGGLDLGLGGDWDLGQQVADTVDGAALAQRGREGLLDR
jgi:hypothetical protein